jgi:UDP-N-acetylglucosamine--N-acetylmuramyl-(pentapeptide) pyrophosphoryl-undecaprenol N-acetylglucosamine transferase
MSDFNHLRDKYKTTNLSFKLFDFLKEMHYAYSAVDLVISRAGATTLGEIIFFGLPAILIPYPFAHQHQMVNAKLLTDCGAAILIKDNELSAATLKKVLLDLLRDEQGINRMRKKYAELSAASVGEDLVDLVSSLMG